MLTASSPSYGVGVLGLALSGEHLMARAKVSLKRLASEVPGSQIEVKAGDNCTAKIDTTGMAAGVVAHDGLNRWAAGCAVECVRGA